jgi:hypothetical protein
LYLLECHKLRIDEKCQLCEAAKESLQLNVEQASPDLFIQALPGWESRSVFIGREGHDAVDDLSTTITALMVRAVGIEPTTHGLKTQEGGANHAFLRRF